MYEKSKLIFSPLASLLFLIMGSSFFMTFIYYAVISVAMSIVGIISILTHTPVRSQVQQEYEPLMPVTSIAYELDPRQDEEL